jgi:U6 snRNA-associated Sm-like protein LSm8
VTKQPTLYDSYIFSAKKQKLTVYQQVLNNAVERIIRTPDDPEPSAQVPLGLYLVRGDNVCSIGLVDEALDDSINWTEVKGSAIGGTKHS